MKNEEESRGEERGGNLLLRVMLEAMDGSNTWREIFIHPRDVLREKSSNELYFVFFRLVQQNLKNDGKDSLVFEVQVTNILRGLILLKYHETYYRDTNYL